MSLAPGEPVPLAQTAGPGLVPDRTAPQSAQPPWREVPEREKWIMTWGVTWRQWVAALVLWVVFFLIFLLLAAAFGGLSQL